LTIQKLVNSDQINTSQVRVINSDGTQIGVININEALKKAKNQKLDLVLVSSTAKPPVCKIMNYGKAIYEEKKRLKIAKSKQTIIHTKEIQLRPVTDVGDLRRKIDNAKKFLEQGNKVRFHMKFRGREITHLEIGMDMMKKILDELGNNIIIEKEPTIAGKNILMVVSS